jgi:hypothetical protein
MNVIIFNLVFFYMVHRDANHLVDTAAVKDFEFVELGTGEGPGIASPEEDIDGGGSK